MSLKGILRSWSNAAERIRRYHLLWNTCPMARALLGARLVTDPES